MKIGHDIHFTVTDTFPGAMRALAWLVDNAAGEYAVFIHQHVDSYDHTAFFQEATGYVAETLVEVDILFGDHRDAILFMTFHGGGA